MKALTLRQPYATLHAILAKGLEWRNWSTDYRGPVAIHSAKDFSPALKDLCFEEPFAGVLHAAGVKRLADLPLGSIVTVSDLRDIYTRDQVRELVFNRCSPWRPDQYQYAFDLGLIERLEHPLAERGNQGMWELPKDVSAFLMTRVAAHHQHQSPISREARRA